MFIFDRPIRVQMSNRGACNLLIPAHGDRPEFHIWRCMGGGWRWANAKTWENSEKIYDSPAEALWDIMGWDTVTHDQCVAAGLIEEAKN